MPLKVFITRTQGELDPDEFRSKPEPVTGKDGDELGWTLLALSRYKEDLRFQTSGYYSLSTTLHAQNHSTTAVSSR